MTLVNEHADRHTSSRWITADRMKLFVLYLLLTAGGLWHLLGVLETTMTRGAPLAMAGLSSWLIYEYLSKHRKKQTSSGNKPFLLVLWMTVVFTGSIAVEYIGVETGIVFGTYIYGDTLKPVIGSVPVVIGFAWLSMILSSAGVVERLASRYNRFPLVTKAVLISFLMVIFDFIMEPAAVELGYWSWEGGVIPAQNYLAWFVLSLIFMILAYGMNVMKKGIPVISRHAYYAQLIYFVLVNIKS